MTAATPDEGSAGDAPLARAEWAHLIPHAGAMCLLDEVIAFDASRIHARSRSHVNPHNPLRSDGRLRALHLCEYGAQAMAVHGGLLTVKAGGAAHPGLLVALREVSLHVARVDDLAGALDIHAERLAADPGGFSGAFRVLHAGRLLAAGRASVLVTSPATG